MTELTIDDELLQAIFLGPLEAEPWKSFLQMFSMRLHGKMATITLRLPHLGAPREQIVHDTVCGTMVDSYIDHFFALDPIRPYPTELGTAILFDDIMHRDEFKKTEFYRDFLAPNNIIYGMKSYFGDPNGLVGWLQIARGVERGNFSVSDKAYCSAVLPHLSLSLRIYGKLMQTETERQLYKGIVDRMAIGAVILDSRDRIMKMNATARSIIQHQPCLTRVDGKLYVRSSQQNRLFQAMIARAQEARADLSDPHFIESLQLDGHAGKVGVLIKSAPIIPWYEGQTCPSVVILLSDPTRPHIAPEQLLISLLAISPAEARLALLLANGHSLPDIAGRLDISINTVRTQLKSIFAKTGTHTQAELVRLILRSVAFLA